MDVRVRGNLVEAVKWRIACSLTWLEPAEPWQISPTPPAQTWDGGFVCYSDAERDAVVEVLKKQKVASTVTAEDQPDPALLTALQGKVSTRSEALACLAAGRAPVTIEDLDQRMRAVETRAIR